MATDVTDAKALLSAVRVLRAHITDLERPAGFDFEGKPIAVKADGDGDGGDCGDCGDDGGGYVEEEGVGGHAGLEGDGGGAGGGGGGKGSLLGDLRRLARPRVPCGINGCPLPSGHTDMCAIDA
eukprot:952-Pleurochrysis_carterae.AAC.1